MVPATRSAKYTDSRGRNQFSIQRLFPDAGICLGFEGQSLYACLYSCLADLVLQAGFEVIIGLGAAEFFYGFLASLFDSR